MNRMTKYTSEVKDNTTINSSSVHGSILINESLYPYSPTVSTISGIDFFHSEAPIVGMIPLSLRYDQASPFQTQVNIHNTPAGMIPVRVQNSRKVRYRCNSSIVTFSPVSYLAKYCRETALNLASPAANIGQRKNRAKREHEAKNTPSPASLSEKVFRFMPAGQEENDRAMVRGMIEASLARARYYGEREEIALRAGSGETSSRSLRMNHIGSN